ncbi:MAG: hypothetical protein Q9224_002934 [Gallowayella concinna]
MGQLLSKGDQDEGLQPAKPANNVTDSMRGINQGIDWNSDESLFKYTSGRWLFNEKKQLAKRSSKFDMNTLARLAAESVGSHTCSDVVKLAESDLNKIYLMKTNDSKEVIAKVPHTGLSGGTIASEVATMDYVRNVLDLPVPKVHAWSSKSTANTVGTEFIVMDKAPGVELRHVWQGLNHNQKYDIVKAVVEQETKLTTSTFDAIGSLYYADTDADPQSKRFIVGPTTERWVFDGRGEFACDRGPWSRVEDYLVAIGRRQLSSVKSLDCVPRSPGIFGNGPGWYKPSTTERLSCLEDYVKIAPYLPPYKDPSVIAAVLWHFDLHDGNIFVDPDHPTNITCIIDWQYASVRPLFRHAGHPAFLDFKGPKPLLGVQGDAAKIPTLPDNYTNLSKPEQKAAVTLLNQQKLYKTYEMFCALRNPSVHNALRFGETVQAKLIALINHVSSHSELAVKALLMEVESGWDEIRKPDGPPCPIEYSENDCNTLAEEFPRWMNSTALLDALLERLGVDSKDWDGQVVPERFAAQKAVFDNVREEFLNQATTYDSLSRLILRTMPPKPPKPPVIPDKVLDEMIEKCKTLITSWTPRRIADLLSPPPENAAGSRFLPPVHPHRDEEWGLRIDKGRPIIINQKPHLQVNLQVNHNAKNPALKSIDKHAKLAKFNYDLTKPAVAQSVLEILEGLKAAHDARQGQGKGA